MLLLRSLRILGTDVLQICCAYGVGFTDDRPANPAAAGRGLPDPDDVEVKRLYRKIPEFGFFREV
jgi:hypothetical protein